jgi:hypothetical protein
MPVPINLGLYLNANFEGCLLRCRRTNISVGKLWFMPREPSGGERTVHIYKLRLGYKRYGQVKLVN